MSEYSKAKRRVQVSLGESVRILCELQELSQKELFRVTHIPQSTLSAIERGLAALSIVRAKTIVRALKCHPAVLVFPGWDVTEELADWRCRHRRFLPSVGKGRCAGSVRNSKLLIAKRLVRRHT